MRIISSMATKGLLATLVSHYQTLHPGAAIELVSVGGVDAARRVQDGEVFDAVVLAANAIDNLIRQGHLLADTRTDLTLSEVAVAVPAGTPHPDIATEDGLKAALVNAQTVGVSTGPSGVELGKLFAQWGLADALQGRIVIPPPGTPVAALLAKGEVTLGFQQLSEMTGVDGIDIVGPLPATCQIVTTFTAAVSPHSAQPDLARDVVAFFASAAAIPIKLAAGMKPA